MKGKVIDPSFPKELLRYKILLKEIRNDLGCSNSSIAESAGCSIVSFGNFISLPLVGGYVHQKALPVTEVNDAIIAFYRGEASRNSNNKSIDAKIDELDKLHKEFVVPELKLRKENIVRSVKESSVRRLDNLEPKTQLTKIIIKQMQRKNVIFGHIDPRLMNLYTNAIECLDYPYSERYFSVIARSYLDQIINYEPLGFNDIQKDGLRELFYINCWKSICPEGFSESNPIEAYKTSLTVLMMQTGTSEAELGELIGFSRERIRHFINLDELFANVLPNKEQHHSICSFFRQKLCDEEDLAEFGDLHKIAYSEKERLDQTRGFRINPDDAQGELGRFILEQMEKLEITYGELATHFGISKATAKKQIIFAGEKPDIAREIIDLLAKKSQHFDRLDDPYYPTYHEAMDNNGKVTLEKDNFLPEGTNPQGKRFILGFSGISWQERLKLESLYNAALAKG